MNRSHNVRCCTNRYSDRMAFFRTLALGIVVCVTSFGSRYVYGDQPYECGDQPSSVEIPDAEIPAAEIPDAETPAAEIPDAETPAAETLDAEKSSRMAKYLLRKLRNDHLDGIERAAQFRLPVRLEARLQQSRLASGTSEAKPGDQSQYQVPGFNDNLNASPNAPNTFQQVFDVLGFSKRYGQTVGNQAAGEKQRITARLNSLRDPLARKTVRDPSVRQMANVVPSASRGVRPARYQTASPGQQNRRQIEQARFHQTNPFVGRNADALLLEEQNQVDSIGPFNVIQPEAVPLVVRVRRAMLLRTEEDVYRTAVVDPSICDLVQFTPREVSIIGKSVGTTNVTFWFQNSDRLPITYILRVVSDPDARIRLEDEYKLLADLLSNLFPDSKVDLVPLADKLVVKGQAKDSEEAAQILQIIRGEVGQNTGRGGSMFGGRAARVFTKEETGGQAGPDIEIVNMLRVPGSQQVALRVKIAELNRSAARGFGIDVDAEVNVSDSAATFVRSMLNMAAGSAPSVITRVDGDDITFGLHWLEEEGVVRMLSEPTLVTLSGRPATFVAGGEFAVPTIVGAGGVSAVTTDYRAFGAIISFLPIVIDKDRIRLQVSPEFSQINTDLNVGDNLGLDVRAVTTTVEMREGQTLAIAGLLDDTMKGDKVGDLPVLSHVFGRRGTSHSETELIILVTPELIHPMEPEEVPPLPGFDVTDPNNTEFFIQGHLEGIPTRNYHSTAWPRLRRRYQGGGPAMISGPFGHGQ